MPVEVADDGCSLLEALRDRLGRRSAKDGCSPQGQCGCCTVWVDGAARVACVTPVRRVAGRSVTTLEGLEPAVRDRWAEAFFDHGASQCGFCTPGIIMRLAAQEARHGGVLSEDQAKSALVAHLCRCTGWQTIVEAATGGPAGPAGSMNPVGSETTPATGATPAGRRLPRDLDVAARRARLEGGVAQVVGAEVALGRGGFADDTAPADALVAVPDAAGGWAVGETLSEARAAAAKVQGRRTTLDLTWPIEVPEGDWALRLATTWVEPAYLETDASWCVPGGDPVTPLANGGAFGAKVDSPVGQAARALADQHGRPVRVVFSREDAVRRGPKRPPLAAGVRPDGTGLVRVARTPGIAEAIASVAPGLVVEEVDIPGPPTSAAIRGAGWMEAAVLLAAAGGLAGASQAGVGQADVTAQGEGRATVTAPGGGRAEATIATDGTVRIRVGCGEPLDEVVLRSYCIGAAHMALGWVRSEGLAVDAQGEIQDLTIRSFGILRSKDMPRVEVEIEAGTGPAVNGSDAVMAAVAAAAWLADGLPERWPHERGRVNGR